MAIALPTLDSPAEVLARYQDALAHDQLVQASWHATAEDGRWLACALGVIGEEVDSPRDCPASIMPRWLAQMVPAFFDRQKLDDAKDWGLRFYAALAKVGGNVPFSTVHHWHAHTVCPLGVEAAEKRGRDTAPHAALQGLHLRALAGEKIGADEWRPALKDAYANAYAYAYAYAYANADAYAYAYAYADADADAYAYADADADAYAYAYAYAEADAYAYAYAEADAWKRLADGMVAAIEATGGAA